MSVGGVSRIAPTEQHEENCYETPPWLVARVRACLGSIDLDPCTNSKNPTGAKNFYTASDDGILQEWQSKIGDGGVFVNPPYGKTIKHWVDKALFAAAHGCKVIMLVPSRTDTAWFHDLVRSEYARDVLLIRRRLQFGDTGANAPFPSAVVGLNVSLLPLSDIGFLCAEVKDKPVLHTATCRLCGEKFDCWFKKEQIADLSQWTCWRCWHGEWYKEVLSKIVT